MGVHSSASESGASSSRSSAIGCTNFSGPQSLELDINRQHLDRDQVDTPELCSNN
jgi:hypothetical protein